MSESTKECVLLVEDEDIVRLSLARVLQRAGYDAVLAAGGAEALEICRERSFRLVITDFCMPGMDGLELIGQIKAILPRVKVILISAQSEQVADMEPYRRRGVFDILSKPFAPESLLNAMARALAITPPDHQAVG